MPNTKRMRRCFFCGEQIGLMSEFDKLLDTCGCIECEKEARELRRLEDADARAQAEKDNYARYR